LKIPPERRCGCCCLVGDEVTERERCFGGDDAVARVAGLAVERLVGLADEPDGAARTGSSARF
jgi:hypothetical protein